LLKKLAQNRVVSIQDSGSGRSLELPFLTGYRSFFLGPPSIALASGATLLPAFPFREPDGTFGIAIGTPIAALVAGADHSAAMTVVSEAQP
jgi:lauroyl/myristoyl acyltransferase